MNRSDTASPVNGLGRRNTRTRSRASSITDRFSRIAEDEPLEPPIRPTISSRSASGQNSPRRELPGFDLPSRPTINRSASGFEGPTSIARDHSPASAHMPRLSRVPTEPSQITSAKTRLRSTRPPDSDNESGVFGDDQSDYSDSSTTLERARTTSWSMAGHDGSTMSKKKPPPPPPPPSRSTKPPPPPPLKRSALSTSEVPNY